MLYTIKNDNLSVTVSNLGAEMQSITRNGVEYLHDGNPDFWSGRAPIMFPICGRLFEGRYTYDGVLYEMTIHGIVKKEIFDVFEADKESITFKFSSNKATLKAYPFEFDFFVTYKLDNDTLTVSYKVINLDNKIMPFSLGGHPGFKVPLEGKGDFTDCYVEFDTACPAKKIDFTPTCFMTGNDKLYDGENLKVINLSHSLFDDDAIFLYDTSKTVTLKSHKCATSVRVDFDGFKYIGLWHAPHKECPYVCIEPWTGCPSYDQKIDDFSTKKDMEKLASGKSYEASFSITIK